MTDQETRALRLSAVSSGTQARFRFAPSPTGPLHVGSAASALLNFRLAKQCGGTFLLRIEDIDLGRCRETHLDGIFEGLAWLGLSWPAPVMRQSRHFPRYQLALDILRTLGVVYPCFATRSEIAAAAAANPDHPCDPEGAPLYPGICKGMSGSEIAERRAAGEAMSWRLDMDRAINLIRSHAPTTPLTYVAWDGAGHFRFVNAAPERWGDFVVARKDTPTSYHLAVVVDDAYQGITHVVRGMDLEPATDIHRLLQALLGLATPVYYHHALILDEHGRKLSKSSGDTSLSGLRQAGLSAEDVGRQALHFGRPRP